MGWPEQRQQEAAGKGPSGAEAPLVADLSREQSLHSPGQPEVREVRAKLSPEPGQG